MRNAKGDIEFEDYKFDHERYRWWRYTYVFHYLDKINEIYRPFFDIVRFEESSLTDAKVDADYCEIILFRTPDLPPFDFSIQYHNWMLGLYTEYFKEVFDIRAFRQGFMPSFEYFRIILPKHLYADICNFINENELLHVKDLILHIISVAQNIVTEEVGFWNRPEQIKRVNNIHKETSKLIDLIKTVTEESRMGENKNLPSPELLHINFCFENKTIKISDPWVCKEFVELFKEKYDTIGYHDWQKELKRLPGSFEEHRKMQKFKERFAKALQNFFVKGEIFKQGIVGTPNKLMVVIAKIIEYSLLEIGNSKTLEVDKIRIVRNWVKRNEVREDITFIKVPVNKNILCKYFEKDFIESEQEIKRADTIEIGYYICMRFDCMHILSEIIHIVSCLKEVGHWYGHQLNVYEKVTEKKIPQELQNFSNLFNTIIAKKKLKKISFQVLEDKKEYVISKRLLIYLIETAIRYYFEDHEFEVRGNLLEQTVKVRPEKGETIVKVSGKLYKPETRFVVKTVSSFYNFLLNEFPPSEKELSPSNKYYLIIGLTFQKTGIFYNQFHSETFVQNKVKQWHELTL